MKEIYHKNIIDTESKELKKAEIKQIKNQIRKRLNKGQIREKEDEK